MCCWRRGEDDEHEADTDALYIQPPQASRESGSGSRREKKKHSRERRRHKEREDLGLDRDHRYEYRNREEHYHHHHRERGGNVAAAYPKHHLGHAYHYPQPPQQQQQQPLPPAPSYAAHHHHHHQHLGGTRAAPRGDYHSYPSGYHSTSRHADYPMEEPPRRGGGKYAESKDAESLEQDLRSRLLKKRHNYVKDYETEENYERGERRKERERTGRGGGHKPSRHERVIELLDSPETEQHHHQHKSHRSKWRGEETEQQLSRRKVPEDLELLARRDKLLAAERDSRQRKQTAREELEARRELLRERNEHSDALSPTAVAASVTAGLNIQVKRKSKPDGYEKEVKHKKRREEEEIIEVIRDDDDEEEESEESDSNEEDHEEDSAESATETGSEESYAGKKKSKIKPKAEEDDEDLPLPDSPLSVGELYKSPKQRQRSRSASSKSSSQTSRSSRSRSRSRSQSSLEDGEAGAAASPSSSTRSEERGMTQQQQAEEKPEEKLKEKALKTLEEQIPCDDKGVPLPNYYPGVQGCRSVEEFQCLNRIEEGTYGVVYRAKDKRTNEIVALKRLKMEKEKEGFPITSLREINTLLKGQHPNIVTVREIVVGSNMDKIFIVMDYVEHDLKSLMETMKNRKQSFFPGEVKCLTQQLLKAVAHLHDNWILHRDLKTSNLLLSHKGILKVGDFGLAREYGSPIKKYTSLVVTLWYRAPELLLCSPVYSTPIDVWSVGCIFAEFLQMLPLFPGKSEIDELNRIFKELGTPNEKVWPGYTELPAVKNMLSQNSQFTEYPVSQLRKHFQEKTSEMGLSLLQGLLTYDPKKRLTADAALKHDYFKELPLPIDPSMFPTWPAKSELGARKAQASSPKPPSGGSQFKQLGRDEPIAVGGGNKLSSGIITGNKKSHAAGGSSSASTGFVLNAGITQRQLAMGPGFSLKF
ncbi:serine/threonine-protein kinase PITSLRE isoform X2 [Drosophila takahashii]|uniref:serine/threonine-protein kinase PITSLRE isoform X2 n=1 Tax=Drosophila takahashii TaxID=29030 RepID=UPI001CF8EEA2|nr:serine/threonine-protein kinase PITSLRE isoform X2 [Drosophila takahashii]XP_044250373.1 serine/threonine-protein kinase PITSLRE isoform X2 [Drosophila takahashii]